LTDLAIDSSIALAWALPDERSSAADAVLEKVAPSSPLWVPALWWVEIANTLAVARRRKRITEAQAARVLELLGALPVQTDAAQGPEGASRLCSLAQRHALSAYDAAYLELAERRGLRLATLDGELSRAARRAGVPLLER